jgi:L-arabinonolactonase
MLYITSARDGLDAAALAGQPSAGALFAAPAGTTGLPEPRFAGVPPTGGRNHATLSSQAV